jgi:hypothetical protein
MSRNAALLPALLGPTNRTISLDSSVITVPSENVRLSKVIEGVLGDIESAPESPLPGEVTFGCI